jgi:hypothetical protein
LGPGWAAKDHYAHSKEESLTTDDDWLAAERERHGPVTEDDIHRGYDAYLDAMLAARQAEKDKPPPED